MSAPISAPAARAPPAAAHPVHFRRGGGGWCSTRKRVSRGGLGSVAVRALRAASVPAPVHLPRGPPERAPAQPADPPASSSARRPPFLRPPKATGKSQARPVRVGRGFPAAVRPSNASSDRKPGTRRSMLQTAPGNPAAAGRGIRRCGARTAERGDDHRGQAPDVPGRRHHSLKSLRRH